MQIHFSLPTHNDKCYPISDTDSDTAPDLVGDLINSVYPVPAFVSTADKPAMSISTSLPTPHERCMEARQRWLANGDLDMVETTFRNALMATKTVRTKEGKRQKVQALSKKDYRSAAERMALLLCQSGRATRAKTGLERLGYSCRLASQVLDYPLVAVRQDSRLFQQCPCRIYDNFLSNNELQHLQSAFSDQTASYWVDHDYEVEPPSPYFSYLIRRKEFHQYGFIGALMKKVHQHLIQDFPQLDAATTVEMWAHNRPHASGHQLHFDSDNEGQDGVRNPILSTILYLTGDAGGPSLVTNQTLAGTELASKGWLSHPKEARLVAFDGRVLHGVIPGKGQGNERRITLMFAFWQDIQMRKGDQPGAARPFPTNSVWSQLLRKEVKVEKISLDAIPDKPIALDHIYETLDGGLWTKTMGFPEYEKVFQGF